MAQSARLRLPLLIPGQGQKDITHNEALVSLDLLVQPVVQSRTTQQPPETVAEGACWLVPEGAGGPGAGRRIRSPAGGWRLAVPDNERWLGVLGGG